jgi:F-type H+-transporting ATPase subunit b
VLIDWFTVAAQVVNFLILVVILRLVLYRPVLRAMAERERRIAERLADARQQDERARAEADQYATRLKEIDSARESMLATARRDAEATRQRLTTQARFEIDALKQRWLHALERDRDDVLDDLARSAGREAIEIARAALQHLAGADLGERMVDVYLQRLGETLVADGDLRRELMAGSAEAGSIRVRTSVPLSDGACTRIRAALEDEFGPIDRIAFETNDEMAFGMELRAGGRAVTLTLDNYLTEFSRRFAELLDQELKEARATAGSGPA